MKATNKQAINGQKKLLGLFTKEDFLPLGIILSIAFILRLLFVLETFEHPFFKYLFSDSKIYFSWAVNIVETNNWIGSEVFFMAPGYPYFLAIVFAVFGKSIFLVKILQIIFSCLTVALIYLSGKELGEKAIAILAASLAAIYAPFIFYSGSILSETLQLFFISLFLFLILKQNSFSNTKNIFLVGIALGFAAIFRGNVLIFIMPIILWLYFQKEKFEFVKQNFMKAVVVLIIGTALPILPITLRNISVSEDFVLLTSNGGINFYLGNNENALGIFSAPQNFDLYADLSGKNFAEQVSGKKLTSAEASSFWMKQGWGYIIANPVDAFLLTVKKLFLFFDESENPQSTVMDIEFARDNTSNTLKLPLLNFYLIFLLAFVGLFFLLKNNAKYSLLFYLALAYTVSIIIFFVNGRFRLGVTPIMILLAASGTFALISVIKENELKKLIQPVVAFFAFTFLGAFFVQHFQFSPYDAYASLGNVYFENQEYDKAIETYKTSLTMKEDYNTLVAMGNAYALKKQFREAMEYYQKAVRMKPGLPLAHFNIGLLYSQTGSLKQALNAYNNAIKADSTFADAYRNVGILYYMENNYSESLKYFQKYLELSNDEAAKKSVLQDVENLKRMLQQK